MPFIDADFLLDERESVRQILITSADDSDVVKTSFELAKILNEKGADTLWVDGNLGEQQPVGCPENPPLEKVIQGQSPLTHAIQQIDGISILTGKSEHFFAEISEIQQYQFLKDLHRIYSLFDKIILSVDGKNPALQKKWMNEAEEIYLLFNSKNLLLNRTLNWLHENAHKTKGLIGIGSNHQSVLLAYMRLREILGELPELILDIKKIAP